MKAKLARLDSFRKNSKNIMVIAIIFSAILGSVLIICQIFKSLRQKNALHVKHNRAPIYKLNIKSKGDVNMRFPEDEYYEDEYETEEVIE